MRYFLFALILGLFLQCKEDQALPTREYPRVRTEEVLQTDSAEIPLVGRIELLGSHPIIDHGFVWTLGPFPTLGEPGDSVSLGVRKDSGRFSTLIPNDLIKKRQHQLRAYARTENHLVYGDLVSFTPLGKEAPVIESMQPKKGVWGTKVTLTGINFTANPTEITLTLQNELGDKWVAEVLSSTRYEIKFKVPEIVSPVDSFQLVLRIKKQQIAYKEYFRLLRPKLHSFSPTEATFLDSIVLNGENFSPDPGKNKVRFGLHLAEIQSASETELVVVVPIDLDESPVTLSHEAYGVVNSVSGFSLPVPIIDSVSPRIAYVGQKITVYGQNLNPARKNNHIMFDDTYPFVHYHSTQSANPIWFGVADRIFRTKEPHPILRVAGLFSSQKFSVILKGWIRRPIPVSNLNSLENAVGFSLMGKGYICLGEEQFSLNNKPNLRLWEFDPENSTWALMAPFLGVARESPIAFTVGDKAYVGLGQSMAGDTLQDLWRYDPILNTWTQVADYPGPLAGSYVSVVVNNIPFVLASSDSANVWTYNATTNQWMAKSDGPFHEQEQPTVAFNLLGTAYVLTHRPNQGVGGYWAYDPLQDNWTNKADFPTNASGISGFSIGDRGYVINRDLYVYSPGPNVWTGPIGSQTAKYASNFVIGESGYILVGFAYDARFWEFRP